MNRLEIITMTIGFIGIFTQGLTYKRESEYDKDDTAMIVCMIANVLYKIIFVSLILFPLYFNFWKK